MRRRLAAYRITVAGWTLLVLVPVLVLVGIFGPQGATVPSLVAAMVLALFVVGSTFSGQRSAGAGIEAVQRAAAEMGPRKGPQPIERETYDPDAWRRERERREALERGESEI